MYLQNENESIVVSLESARASADSPIVIDYNDHNESGMVLPQSSTRTFSDGTTPVTILEGDENINRQIAHMSLYNKDTDVIVATFYKDISSTAEPIIKATLNPGETLIYSRDGSWSIFSTTSQRRVVLRSITTTSTYSPGSWSYALMAAVGGGAGAGAGMRGAAGTNRFGGGGGGGGAFVQKLVTRAEAPDSIAITIGAGGTGGAAQTVDSTAGAAGTAGGDTSIGAIVVAKGGNPGGGGSTSAGTAGSGGQLTACTPIAGPFSLSGANGTAGNTTTNAAGITGFLGTGAPGGGGGGGINSTNTSGTAANSGGSVYQNGTIVAGPTSGASPNGRDNQCLAVFPSGSLTPLTGLGTGGAGNNPATPNGGNGGLYGAGGGGGAGVLNGTNSGKGGDGAQGAVWILEIYA